MEKVDMISSNAKRINTVWDDCEDLYCIDCWNKFNYDDLYDVHSFWNEEEWSYICIDCDTVRYLNNK